MIDLAIKSLFTIFLLFMPHLAHGFDLGLGGYALALEVHKRPTDSNGVIDNMQPYVSVSHRWLLSGKHFFAPELGYVFGHKATNDSYGAIKKTTLFLLYDFAWASSPGFFLYYGVGTFRTTIKGEGGEITVPSRYGTGVAYRPSGESTSHNATLNFGAEYIGRPRFLRDKSLGGKIEGFMFSFLRNEKRTFGYTFSLKYFF